MFISCIKKGIDESFRLIGVASQLKLSSELIEGQKQIFQMNNLHKIFFFLFLQKIIVFSIIKFNPTNDDISKIIREIVPNIDETILQVN